jgi:glycogen(starch) synthase
VTSEQIKKVRAMYDAKDDDYMILFIGRLVGVKGVEKLIMALPHILQRNPKTELVIVGLGDLQEYLLNLVKAAKMSDFVKFRFEFIPEEERILHYAACDVAVFPSFYEPFGIVVLEAMSMARPVVIGAAGISGMREIVTYRGEEQCGYHADPGNPSDIAWGMNCVLENDEKRKWLGKNGRRRVLNEFAWENIAEKTLGLYEHIIKR